MDFFEDSEFMPPRKPKVRIEKPEIRSSMDEKLWKEAQRYARFIEHAPDPHLGRIQEIKDEIQDGTYVRAEMIDVAAERLIRKFLKRL